MTQFVDSSLIFSRFILRQSSRGSTGTNSLSIPRDYMLIPTQFHPDNLRSRRPIESSTRLFLPLDHFAPFCTFVGHFYRTLDRSVSKILLSYHVGAITRNLAETCLYCSLLTFAIFFFFFIFSLLYYLSIIYVSRNCFLITNILQCKD